jgi:hypothetical protein
MRGANRSARVSLIYLCVSVTRIPAHALKVRGDLDKEEYRVGGRGNDLGAGLWDAAAGSTSDHVRRGFCQPFPSYFRQDRSHAGLRLG